MIVSDTLRDERYENSLAQHAKLLCSGVFVVGRNPYEYIENDLRTIDHYHDWDRCSVEVNHVERSVTISDQEGRSRTAVCMGDQGCTILPDADSNVAFEPVEVDSELGPPNEQCWPMGSVDAVERDPTGVDTEALSRVLDRAVSDNPTHAMPANTRAVVVVHDGKIVGERYASGFDESTRHVSWSMGKSVTAALVGVLVREGHFDVDEPAPIEEWRDDERSEIMIGHLLRMSSGLAFDRSVDDPDVFALTDADDHYSVYCKPMDVFEFATSRPLEHEPNTKWRYRNCDTLSLGKIVRDTVEASGRSYLAFPQRALYDRIGIRNMVHETDLHGNFITSGFNYGTARDWARFGLLHLQDGEWLGEQILPDGWVDYVTTPAPAHPDDAYGGQFWLNESGDMKDVPRDAYSARGLRGQITTVIPSLDVVIVRLGHATNYSQQNTLIREICNCIER